jgi:hypothetical protein
MIAVDKMGTKVLFLNPVTYETELLLEDFPRTMHELLVPTFAGALFTGQISRWTCQWLMVTIRAEWERIWIGDQKVAIARDRFLNGRHRACAGYDYRSRHKDRWALALDRLLSLRRRIELGHPLHRWSKRKIRHGSRIRGRSLTVVRAMPRAILT